MASVIDFLRQNEQIVVALFTVVIAIATIAYAALTWFLVRETRRLREAQVEPLVGVFLRTSEPWSISLDFVIRNFGPGPAHDLRLEIQADVDDLRKHMARIDPILAFKEISYLAPAQEVRFFLGTAPSLLGGETGPPAKPVRVTASYKTPKGKDLAGTFVLDVASLLETALAQRPADERIAEVLSEIARAIRSKNHHAGP